MKSTRQDANALYFSLAPRFGWVKSVDPYMGPHFPSSKYGYTVELVQLCKKIRNFPDEKQRFDSFVKEYFGIPQWRNQLVTIWNQGHVTLIVF